MTESTQWHGLSGPAYRRAVVDKHLKFLCRYSRVPFADVKGRLGRMDAAGRCANEIRERIRSRGGSCTHKAAASRVRAADAVLIEYYRQRREGDARRKKAAMPALLSPAERKSRQIQRLITWRLPGTGYSGDTNWVLTATGPDELGSARTELRYGDRYSSSSRHWRTDATHHIGISLTHLLAARRAGIPEQIDGELVVAATLVRPAIWRVRVLRTVGNKAESRDMYIADQGDGQWHLAKTERGAAVALGRSQRAAADKSNAQRDLKSGRITGRVVRDWGWCSNGVRQWCSRHNVTRNLSERLRTGASSRAIARLIARHGGPRDSYDSLILKRLSMPVT